MRLGMGVNGVPDEKRKSCFDCNQCQGAVSWWCVNEQAAKARGTKIPGVVHCPHWEPIPTKEELYENANFFSRLLGIYKVGYIEVDLSKNRK
jgi:hypothetical protein